MPKQGKNARKAERHLEKISQANRLTFYPPSFEPRVQFVHKFRFRDSTAISEAAPTIVTKNCILNLLLAVSTETTTVQATRLISSFRIRHIEMWVMRDAAMGLTELRWLGGNSPSKETSIYGTMAHPGYMKSKPGKGCLAGDWQNVSSADLSLFSITNAENFTVLDLTVDLILADSYENTAEAQTEVTLTAATASGLYACGLDNVLAGTGVANPNFDMVGLDQVIIATDPLVGKPEKSVPTGPPAPRYRR